MAQTKAVVVIIVLAAVDGNIKIVWCCYECPTALLVIEWYTPPVHIVILLCLFLPSINNACVYRNTSTHIATPQHNKFYLPVTTVMTYHSRSKM